MTKKALMIYQIVKQEWILRPLARVQWPQKPQPQTERESARKNPFAWSLACFGGLGTYMRLFNRKRKEPSERPPAASSLKTH